MSEQHTAEIEATHARYLEARTRAEAGETPWSALAGFFTDDATFIDPAWGRIDGIDAIRNFLDESMAGLEGWTFPQQWTMVEGNRLVSCWKNRLPGRRSDGSFYEATGISILEYAGNGKFSYEEDILNMAHVHELMAESRWKPGPGINRPPKNPRR